MACPGLANHTLAGLCAQWLPSIASINEGLQDVSKPEEASQTTTCTALPQPPVQAPPDLLLTTAQGAFDLAVAQGIPRTGHPHTGGALCPGAAEHSLHH